MKRFDWDIEKNKKLIQERNISFEEIIIFIEQGNILDIIDNPNPKYYQQKMFVLDIEGYVYIVREGMPYQTLISSIIHKFVVGGLKDV